MKDHLVDSTEGWHIHSLPPDGTSTTNTGGVLTGSAVDDGVHQDLEGVLEMEKNQQHRELKLVNSAQCFSALTVKKMQIAFN